jgi:dihydrofolate reductase
MSDVRPLHYSINVTLDGCCHHEGPRPTEAMHRYTAEILARADALILGRVTYEMMEAGWRSPSPEMPAWMRPFAEVIGQAKKYVVSRTLQSVDWNAELVRGDAVAAVRALKQQPGNGLYVGGVNFPLQLADAGLIDEFELIVHPRIAGHGPTLFAGLAQAVDLELTAQKDLGDGIVARTFVPRR